MEASSSFMPSSPKLARLSNSRPLILLGLFEYGTGESDVFVGGGEARLK
jgi:hypothetical protein